MCSSDLVGLLKVMGELGNTLVNRIYLAKTDVLHILGIQRATPSSSREVRETWIRAKYVDRAFVLDPKINGTSEKQKKVIRKWSVKKPNRKSRNMSGNTPTKEKAANAELPPTPIPTTSKEVEDNGESDGASSSSKGAGSNTSEADSVLVFGSDEKPSTTSVIDQLGAGEESAEETDSADIVESIDTFDSNTLLYAASRVANLAVMCEAVALGADTNWSNPKDDYSYPLHQGVRSGSVTACEFLILNGARVNCQDKMKQTPLFLATQAGHTGQICLFLRNRADHRLANIQGNSPLDLAVQSENADIVTLLRLARMDEEMSNETDDTFQEIVRDIAKKVLDSKQGPSTSNSAVTFKEDSEDKSKSN